jgi:hypothetical protein
MIQIPLDLSRHCLYSEIRRLYNRMLSSCLKSAEQEALTGKKLELLKQALETWDFPTLRADHGALAGGRNNTVALVTDEDGRPAIMIDGQFITAKMRILVGSATKKWVKNV